MRTIRRCFSLGLALAAGVPAPVFALGGTPPVFFVDDDAPPGGDGSSWDSAFRHLQDALAAAGATGGGEISVARGVYRPDRSSDAPEGTSDRLASFRLVDGVTLRGGYAGLGHANPDERDPRLFPAVLSGDLAGDDDAASGASDNAYHVIQSWNNDRSAVVEGFTIRAGRADRPVAQGWWPAGRDDSGAGALVVHSEAVFRDCLFEDNYADANGSLFIALSGDFGFVEPGGGAMLVSRGAPTIESCVFRNNAANRVGGALSLHRSAAVVTGCFFTGNSVGEFAPLEVNMGGALGDMSADFSTDDRARIESCRFINNTAHGSGGAVFTALCDSVYANCVLLANHATERAGGLYADNVAFVEFHNTAVVGNTSARGAAGVFEFSEVGDAYVFVNCIVWGNRTDEPAEPLNQNMISQNGNIAAYDTIIEQVGEYPVFMFDADRLFATDPVFTDPVGPDGVAFSGDEDLRPAPGSPAIDAGNSSRVPGWLATDLDGRPRFADATAPDTGVGPAPIVDIGPYEAAAGCPADLAEPFGVLNFFDVAAFIALYNDASPAADLAAPFGVLNFFDVAEYIALYNAGCP